MVKWIFACMAGALLASACSPPLPPHVAGHATCVSIAGEANVLEYAIANIEVMKDWDVARPEGANDCTPNVVVQVGTSSIRSSFGTAGYVGGAIIYEPANDLFYHGGISTADSFRKAINWALNVTTDGYAANHVGKATGDEAGQNRVATNGASCLLISATADADRFVAGSVTRIAGWKITEPGAPMPCAPKRLLSILTSEVSYNYRVIGFGLSGAILQLHPPYTTSLSVGFYTSRPEMINDMVEKALESDLF